MGIDSACRMASGFWMTAESGIVNWGFGSSCVRAERYWDPVRWAIQHYRWRFEELAPSRRIERGDGADPSVATMASSRDPAR
jgi:hypothetical protein